MKTLLSICFVTLSAATPALSDPSEEAVNRDWRRAQYEQFVANDGCNGDFLTVEQTSWCWNRDSRGQLIDANPFPPVGASHGGSE